ncbi:MAG: hypothetical protein ABF301_05425 [Sulfurovum sp.]|jgi:nitrogen-specific signal transduction histidine kinase
MPLFEKWVDVDLNPIITFTSSGRIAYSNSEAQFLLSRISQKELFDLAVQYASQTYGINTTYIDLRLKNYVFYAVTVMYENEDEIHLKLYKSATVKKDKKLSTSNTNTTNIFTLVDLAISTNKTKSSVNYKKNYDPSIPEFKLNSSAFIKVLNQVFSSFENSSNIECSIFLKIGEYIKIEGKKYPLISVEISSEDYNSFDELKAKEFDLFIVICERNKVTIDLPLISG